MRMGSFSNFSDNYTLRASFFLPRRMGANSGGYSAEQLRYLYEYNFFFIFIGRLVGLASGLGLVGVSLYYMSLQNANIAIGIVLFVLAMLMYLIFVPYILFALYTTIGLIKKRQ
jgi:hypothetical protein